MGNVPGGVRGWGQDSSQGWLPGGQVGCLGGWECRLPVEPDELKFGHAGFETDLRHEDGDTD